MRSFRRITVALSMTATDVDVLRYAAIVARLGITTRLQFVHVKTSPSPTTEDDRNRLVVRLRETVHAHFGQPLEGTAVSFQVVGGSRVESLIDTAVEHKSELILLGHRRTRAGRRTLARKLAMTGRCSVWMVPEGAALQLSRVLAPVDFSDHSADGLSQAAAIARLQGLDECLALHVGCAPLRHSSSAVDRASGDEQSPWQMFLETVNAYGVPIETLNESAKNTVGAILEYAHRRSVDLLVISTRGTTRMPDIQLGSTTSQLLMESDLPVLIIQQGNGSGLLQAVQSTFASLYHTLRMPLLNLLYS